MRTIAATVHSKSACLRQCKHRTTADGNNHRNDVIQPLLVKRLLHVSTCTAWNFEHLFPDLLMQWPPLASGRILRDAAAVLLSCKGVLRSLLGWQSESRRVEE